MDVAHIPTLTYLSCVLDARKGVEQVDFTVDEANQAAIVFSPRWNLSNRATAAFEPSRVTVAIGFTTYRVDRVTLVIERDTQIPATKRTVEAGMCRIIDGPPERKF